MTDLVNFWSSPNFWRPPYRSWPYPPTRLERLAVRAGLGDEELRALLEREIARRRAVESSTRLSEPQPM